MKPATVIACLAIFACSAFAEETATGAGEHHAAAFCYRDEDGCGPNTHSWADTCHQGQRQSPIAIPANLRPSGMTKLRLLNAYKGNFFRLQNSGHSVSIDFVGESGQNEGPTSKTFTFPDPLNLKQTREYKFASAHLHWGVNDTLGSEHCVGTKCSAAEIHFVHYSANFSTLADAVASGDESALNVLGVFMDASVVRNLFGRVVNTGHPSLAPIVKNLDSVHHASHDGGFVRVDEPIDFTQLIMNEVTPQVYHYKGSLTTPGCNEQVNWFVLKAPAKVSSQDLKAFRTKLQDGNGAVLDQNHRPHLPLNGRKVSLSVAFPTM